MGVGAHGICSLSEANRDEVKEPIAFKMHALVAP